LGRAFNSFLRIKDRPIGTIPPLPGGTLSYEFGAAYFVRDDGKKVYSLRSVGDFDVSEVAKKYGGGGHRNAAGFQENQE